MSSYLQNPGGRAAAMRLSIVALLCGLGALAAAQDRPAPKWELYGGYSAFNPGTDVHGVLPGGVLPVSSSLETNLWGVGASVTYDFNRWLGMTLDASTLRNSEEVGIERADDAALSNLSLGPKITFRHARFSPFLEGLVGDHRFMPDSFHDVQKLGFMAGGGLDINLSRHIALRLIRADYVFSNYRYGPAATTAATDIRGVRLQAGLVFTFGGGTPAVPPSAVCSVEPGEVFAGEPVTGHAAGSGFNPRRTVHYSWTGSGAKVAGADASTQIDTTGLEPGTYTVTASLSDGSKTGIASCSASFAVKRPRPPEISCTSDPGTVATGGSAAIHSSASSPDNRRLSYSYNATAGNISGTDATAALDTTGAQPGSITVTCTVQDDRSPALTASATTSVMVEAPPPVEPPAEVKELEVRLALHSIYFKTARPTEKNPGGGLVESQQDVLASLATGFIRYLTFKPDAHLILGGYADPRGSIAYNQALTERRVERAKSFLVEHGVPPGAIEVKAFGEQDQLTTEQVRKLIEEDPDLSAEDRQKFLSNLPVIVLANNRRVDVSLSTTGQQSVRRYPFNAKDALGLISPKGVEKEPGAKPRPRKK
jgi:outer membrane protein OmpA-like peptidoglycan-associated protein/opacity protein-like surface antigen